MLSGDEERACGEREISAPDNPQQTVNWKIGSVVLDNHSIDGMLARAVLLVRKEIFAWFCCQSLVPPLTYNTDRDYGASTSPGARFGARLNNSLENVGNLI
jgi:hypothetical protein